MNEIEHSGIIILHNEITIRKTFTCQKSDANIFLYSEF